jgi:hypothetical protein
VGDLGDLEVIFRLASRPDRHERTSKVSRVLSMMKTMVLGKVEDIQVLSDDVELLWDLVKVGPDDATRELALVLVVVHLLELIEGVHVYDRDVTLHERKARVEEAEGG